MNIVLNGEPRQVNAAALNEVLAEVGFAGAVVATALNGGFIAAPARAETVLSEGDRLEVLAPMQGG
jgi:sulfur carrier protein